MRFYKYLLLIALCCSTVAHARDEGDEGHHAEELNERDDPNLRAFVESKRDIPLEEKDTNLSISGDVRTEYRHMTERRNGDILRGRPCTKDCRCIPLSHNDFDIELNLRFDYKYKNARAFAHVQYDNSAGIDRIDCFCARTDCEGSEKNCTRGRGGRSGCNKKRYHGSGACDDICLKRAYIGWTPYSDCGVFDIEIGRRMLYDVLESEVQYQNRMDGIVLKYSNKWNGVSDWYVKGIAFIVDERVNHFAYAAELAMFNINDWKLDAKYAIVDWRKWGTDRCGFHNPKSMRFLVSQFLLTYHLNPCYFWGRPSEVYGAVLFNHQAHNSKRWAGYLGLSVGAVDKAGDWAFNIEYQIMEPNCVAYDDQGGIGLGNVRDECCDEIPPTVGFQGIHFDVLYAITDNFTLNLIVEAARDFEDRFRFEDESPSSSSSSASSSSGSRSHKLRHHYSKVELEAIYAF